MYTERIELTSLDLAIGADGRHRQSRERRHKSGEKYDDRRQGDPSLRCHPWQTQEEHNAEYI